MSIEPPRAIRDEKACEDLESLRFQNHSSKRNTVKPNRVFGKPACNGGIYRWGLAVANGGPISPFHQTLSQVAGANKRSKVDEQLDWEALTQIAWDGFHQHRVLDLIHALETILWSASLGVLLKPEKRKRKKRGGIEQRLIEEQTAYGLLATLRRLHEDALSGALPTSSPLFFMLGGELGLTLAWHFPWLPQQRQLIEWSNTAISQWSKLGPESVAASLENPTQTRLALASLFRCEDLLQHVSHSSLPVEAREIGMELSHWVAAMTVPGGRAAFSIASRQDVRDDLQKQGLFDRMIAFDPDSLRPAVSAALGTTKSGGRLSWQVHLPETLLACDQSKLAMMLPEWDVRRGKLHIDYSSDQVAIELVVGKINAIQGTLETTIHLEGQPCHPNGPWEEICRYTDDDVHYLELEQPWTGGLLLQRQFLIVRDDRCVLCADAIVADSESGNLQGEVQYQCVFPLSTEIGAVPESETREILLQSAKKLDRAVVIPLSAPEWHASLTQVQLVYQQPEGGRSGSLTLSAKGRNQLYAPLWIDCERKRLRKQRTWRQLTVADALRICSNSEALAFRIQSGNEQWSIYRSLAGARCRSFLGKQIIANFFLSRFDSDDGSHEDLITLDEDEIT